MDDTHDPALVSWLASANDPGTDFPPQNLPFGRFREAGQAGEEGWRIGVAIGDQVLDLQRAKLITGQDMSSVLHMAPAQRRVLRQSLSAGLRRGSPDELRFRKALLPMAGVELGLPCRIGDYTDFYTGIHHATAVGKLFRPDAPLLPNYKWVPIGYHGRASSIFASGHRFRRPRGQTMPPGATEPTVGPAKRLDYELELGIVIGRSNEPGEPITIAHAEGHVFGMALFNDWSARDVQAWEYQPLGPFLAKNFASTLSPWLVTMEALAPFRSAPQARPEGDPPPLPYLDGDANRASGAIDVQLEVWLQTAAMHEAGLVGDRLSQSNFCDAYWTTAQMVTHHTMGGCNLQSGDLLGTGTLSGPGPHQADSLLELTQGGKQPLTLSNGERRTFVEDGDSVTLRAQCSRPGWRRIGFGECRATVMPAKGWA